MESNRKGLEELGRLITFMGLKDDCENAYLYPPYPEHSLCSNIVLLSYEGICGFKIPKLSAYCTR